MVRLAVFPSICLLLLLTAAIPATSEASGASTSSPGYWLMTGFGSTYAFNAPYLGSELQTVTQSPCQTNGGLAPDIPSCVAILSDFGRPGLLDWGQRSSRADASPHLQPRRNPRGKHRVVRFRHGSAC